MKRLNCSDIPTEVLALFDGHVNLMNRWLDSELPALADKKPRDLLKTSEGRREVARVASLMTEGNFS